MNESESDDMATAIIVCMAVSFIAGLLAGGCFARHDWRAETIQRGFAHYNQTSGNWEWLTNQTQTPIVEAPK